MPSLLPRTELALSDCREHIDNHPDTNPAILDHLTRHINALMCAEVEQVVTQLIVARLAVGQRDEVAKGFFSNFLRERRISSIRNATVKEVRSTLSAFGPDYREKFNELVRQGLDEDEVRRKLETAVSRRNANAHHIPPSITFQELEAAYTVANEVVEAVRVTLEN